MSTPPREYESDQISKKAALQYNNQVRGQIRKATLSYFASVEKPDQSDVELEDRKPEGKFGNPRHVGMRRYVSIPPRFQYTAANKEVAEDFGLDDEDD